jgi:hypothetical protein
MLTFRVSQRLTCTGFYLNLPAGGVAAFLLTFIHFPEVIKKEPISLTLLRKVAPQLDLFGFVLFVPPSIMFILALQFGSGNTYAWDVWSVPVYSS